MRKVKVLIAEWEQNSMDNILSLLDKKSYEIYTARDGVEALQLALQHVPDFIMLSLDLPLIDGVKLSQILRTNPRTESIPIFYMNEKMIQLSHFRRNVDYFIIKPFNKDELGKIILNVSKKILNLQDKKYEEEFAGNLKQMGLPDLIQILSINRRTGNLFIYNRQDSKNPYATVVIQDGKIINAKIGEITKTKAFYRILALQEGYFRFLPGEPLMPEEIKENFDSLIMEGLRQNDELNELKKRVPPDVRLKLCVKINQFPENLRPITKEVLTALEVFQDINDLLDNIDATDYEIIKIVTALIDKGIVKLEYKKDGEKEEHEFTFSSDIVLELKRKLTKKFYDSRLNNNLYLIIFVSDLNLTGKFIKYLNNLNFEPIKEKVFDFLNSKSLMGYLGKIILVESLNLHFFYFNDIVPSTALWNSVLKDTAGAIVLGKRDRFREILGLLGKRYTVFEEKDLLDHKSFVKNIEKIFESYIMEEK